MGEKFLLLFLIFYFQSHFKIYSLLFCPVEVLKNNFPYFRHYLLIFSIFSSIPSFYRNGLLLLLLLDFLFGFFCLFVFGRLFFPFLLSPMSPPHISQQFGVSLIISWFIAFYSPLGDVTRNQ